MLIGKKVIVKGSGEDFYRVGRLIGLTGHDGIIPVILDYKDRQERMIFGSVVLYNKELVSILDDMDPHEQWDYLRPFNLLSLIIEEEKDGDKK